MCKAYFGLTCDVRYCFGDLGGDYAFCYDFDSGEYEIELDREFIRNYSEQEIVQIVAHEMVHVKQHEFDGLHMEVNAMFYKGKFYDEEVESYWFLPWEIEARGYERGFWALYAEKWEAYVEL
jgi:hypothetical protein